MTTPVAPSLAAWTSFYVIIGSAGATLTGLMFVVLALITQEQRRRSTQQIDAFGTPTVVHFCAAILIASALAAPWRNLSHAGLVIGTYGAAGALYSAIVTRRTLRQNAYTPVLEDWVWHSVIPIAAHAALLAAGLALPHSPESRLFLVAAATIALLFVGIHNSWDTLTYVASEPSTRSPPGGAARQGERQGGASSHQPDGAQTR